MTTVDPTATTLPVAAGEGARSRRISWLALLDVRLQLAMATVLGLGLRFWDLRGVPPGLNQDEAVYGYDAYSIFMTGRDHLGHPFPFASLETFGDWSSPLLTYLSIPFVALFGLHVETLRAVSALLGAALIPLVFLLALVLFKKASVGVVAAWVVALSPWAVHLSRWAIIPTAVPTMVAATMLALAWSLEKRNPRGMVLAALLAGLTVASYHAMKAYGPLLVLLACAVYWRDLRRIKLEPLAYAAIVFIVFAGPILYLTVRDPGGSARLAQTSVLHAQSLTPALVIRQYASYFSPSFWFVSGDGDPQHLPPGEGLMPLCLAPLLIAGLVALVFAAFRRGPCVQRHGAIFLLLALIAYPLPGMWTLPNPHVLRAVHAIPLAALVAGYGAIAIADLVTSLSRRREQALAGVAALAVVFSVAFTGEAFHRYQYYFGDYRRDVAVNFHYGIDDALRYVFAHEASADEVWVDDNNSSYIYVLFYKRWDPNDVHSNLQVVRNPPDWNRVVAIGKYHMGWPADFSSTDGLVYTARNPDGSDAYRVVSGQSEGRRVLVVQVASAQPLP